MPSLPGKPAMKAILVIGKSIGRSIVCRPGAGAQSTGHRPAWSRLDSPAGVFEIPTAAPPQGSVAQSPRSGLDQDWRFHLWNSRDTPSVPPAQIPTRLPAGLAGNRALSDSEHTLPGPVDRPLGLFDISRRQVVGGVGAPAHLNGVLAARGLNRRLGSGHQMRREYASISLWPDDSHE